MFLSAVSSPGTMPTALRDETATGNHIEQPEESWTFQSIALLTCSICWFSALSQTMVRPWKLQGSLLNFTISSHSVSWTWSHPWATLIPSSRSCTCCASAWSTLPGLHMDGPSGHPGLSLSQLLQHTRLLCFLSGSYYLTFAFLTFLGIQSQNLRLTRT